MGLSELDRSNYIGKHVSKLPTPALLLRKAVMERNCARMDHMVEQKRCLWRPHVKTLKVSSFSSSKQKRTQNVQCAESTRMMLGSRSKAVIVSTPREIEGLMPLIEEGIVDSVGINPERGRQS